jgi:hypothetical protein
MVCKGHGSGTVTCRHPVEKLVTGTSTGILKGEVLVEAQSPHVSSFRDKRKAAGCGECSDESFVFIGLGTAQGVVQVGNDKAQTQVC